MPDRRLVAQIVEIGPLFAEDTGPAIEPTCYWDAGGYVDLTGATVVGELRRWDPRRQMPLPAIVTSGPATVTDGVNGRCKFDWTAASPVATVPADAGWYVLQFAVTFLDGSEQRAQRIVFEVQQAR